MKKMFLLAIAPFIFASCDKEEILPDNKIPSEIISYIDTHFPENPIIQTVKDSDGWELTYDIILEGGFSLEFNRKKEVIDIEGQSKLPVSVIPAKLLAYIAENYADNFIVGWELEDRNQQIKLDNGLELEFTMAGNFLRIDN
ncbi:MAG: hypothetical protein EOM23_00270 [Candidatus Moranbacteria bacterium]|nr:hypothetical protein [Candidatus Moranbacteria bacterium]